MRAFGIFVLLKCLCLMGGLFGLLQIRFQKLILCWKQSQESLLT